MVIYDLYNPIRILSIAEISGGLVKEYIGWDQVPKTNGKEHNQKEQQTTIALNNMGGLFGVISTGECINDLYYGTDYNSHLGTRRGGMAVFDGTNYARSIHSLENSYFRTKFEPELMLFKGKSGIGVISDTEPQPLLIHSHLGEYAIVRRFHRARHAAQG